MSDPISDALARANAVVSAPPTAMATVTPDTAPVARPRSLEDALATAGLSIDKYIQIKEDGIMIDKMLKPKHESFTATIRPKEIKFGYGVRFQSGGNTQYYKSYNGVTEARSGKLWATVIAQAQQVDSACQGQYDLADIPMVLTEDLSNAENGTRLGYTTAITSYPLLMSWLNEVIPVYGNNVDIPVRISYTTHKKGTSSYGKLKIETLNN